MKENSIIISSRIRLARNLEGYPFGERLSKEKANEIIEKVGSLLGENGFEKINFSTLTQNEAMSYVEKHLASREFAASKCPHALMLNSPCGLSVMLCEEDHLRIQAILPGLALEKAYKTACSVDDLVDEHFDIAFDETLGYLTHCPTNLGTGMRASVMMFLPALSMAGRIEPLARQLSKIGLTVRGTFGEGTGAMGSLYQISGQVTLGITEENAIKKLCDMVRQIEEQETALRALITKEKNPKLIDRIYRAEGTLRHAFMLSSVEFLSLYSDARLGASLGLLENISEEVLDQLLKEVMPATLLVNAAAPTANEIDRDVLRAERIKTRLAVK